MAPSATRVATAESNQTALGICVWIFGSLLFLIGAVNLDFLSMSRIGFFGDTWPLLMGLLLFAAQAIGFLTGPDFSKLGIQINGPIRCTRDDVVLQDLQITNSGRRWVTAHQLTVQANGLSAAHVAVPSLPPGATASVSVLRRALWRAHVPTHFIVLRGYDRLGLRRYHVTYEVARHMTIEPPIVDVIIPLAQWFGGDDDGARADRAGIHPFAVRPWQPGDTLRQVHWRSTARRGELVVMERAVPHEPRLALLFVGDGQTPASEDLVSEFASVGVEAVRAGRRVMVLGWQGGLPFVDWASRDKVVDWAVGVTIPALATRELLQWALRSVGSGGEISVWTVVEMGEDWWAYLNAIGEQTSVRFVRGREQAVFA